MTDWTIGKIIPWGESFFSEKGIETSRLDAEVLLGDALGMDRVQLYSHWDQPLNPQELKVFKTLVQRRARREPLAYILGEKEFYSLKLLVSPEVLIPRPETEKLVELGIDHLENQKNPSPRILDLATGSGCILLALLKKIPSASGIGVDLSEGALEVAQTNGRNLQLEEQTQWIRADLRKDWGTSLAGPFDLITANLPYVSAADFSSLEPELNQYEPREALVPGPEGLESFGWVLPNLAERLSPGGRVLLEIGSTQARFLLGRCEEICPELEAAIIQDDSGLDRVLSLVHP